MTPAELIRYLRREHACIGYPVANCRKDHQNWPCDTIRALDAARAAEREAIIGIASQMRASIPADHPEGAQASFADYLRVTRPEGNPDAVRHR
jgi:hypothetical protein